MHVLEINHNNINIISVLIVCLTTLLVTTWDDMGFPMWYFMLNWMSYKWWSTFQWSLVSVSHFCLLPVLLECSDMKVLKISDNINLWCRCWAVNCIFQQRFCLMQGIWSFMFSCFVDMWYYAFFLFLLKLNWFLPSNWFEIPKLWTWPKLPSRFLGIIYLECQGRICQG